MFTENRTSVKVLTATNALAIGQSITMHLLFCSKKDGQIKVLKQFMESKNRETESDISLKENIPVGLI